MSQQLLDQIKKRNDEVFGYNAVHPELRENEVWLTNVFKDSDPVSITWNTARLGKTAYSIKGIRFRTGLPVFVQESEILNASE